MPWSTGARSSPRGRARRPRSLLVAGLIGLALFAAFSLAVFQDVAAPFTQPLVKNLPLRGVALPCSFEPNYETVDPRTGRRKMQCGRKIQDPNKPPGNFIFDSKGDPTCNMERDTLNPNDKPLECNRDTCFCDAPIVGYGQA